MRSLGESGHMESKYSLAVWHLWTNSLSPLYPPTLRGGAGQVSGMFLAVRFNQGEPQCPHLDLGARGR